MASKGMPLYQRVSQAEIKETFERIIQTRKKFMPDKMSSQREFRCGRVPELMVCPEGEHTKLKDLNPEMLSNGYHGCKEPFSFSQVLLTGKSDGSCEVVLENDIDNPQRFKLVKREVKHEGRRQGKNQCYKLHAQEGSRVVGYFDKSDADVQHVLKAEDRSKKLIVKKSFQELKRDRCFGMRLICQASIREILEMREIIKNDAMVLCEDMDIEEEELVKFDKVLEMRVKASSCFMTTLQELQINPNSRNMKGFVKLFDVNLSGKEPFSLFSKINVATKELLLEMMLKEGMDPDLAANQSFYRRLSEYLCCYAVTEDIADSNPEPQDLMESSGEIGTLRKLLKPKSDVSLCRQKWNVCCNKIHGVVEEVASGNIARLKAIEQFSHNSDPDANLSNFSEPIKKLVDSIEDPKRRLFENNQRELYRAKELFAHHYPDIRCVTSIEFSIDTLQAFLDHSRSTKSEEDFRRVNLILTTIVGLENKMKLDQGQFRDEQEMVDHVNEILEEVGIHTDYLKVLSWYEAGFASDKEVALVVKNLNRQCVLFGATQKTQKVVLNQMTKPAMDRMMAQYEELALR